MEVKLKAGIPCQGGANDPPRQLYLPLPLRRACVGLTHCSGARVCV